MLSFLKFSIKSRTVMKKKVVVVKTDPFVPLKIYISSSNMLVRKKWEFSQMQKLKTSFWRFLGAELNGYSSNFEVVKKN